MNVTLPPLPAEGMAQRPAAPLLAAASPESFGSSFTPDASGSGGLSCNGSTNGNAGAAANARQGAWSREWRREWSHEWNREWRREAQRERERDPQAGLPGNPCGLSPETVPGGAPDAAAAQHARAAAHGALGSSQPHPPAPHVHAEWSDAGVQVWIGAPQGCLAEPGALLSPLRARLERRGMRLLGLVCNGVPLMRANPHANTHATPAEADPVPRPSKEGEFHG